MLVSSCVASSQSHLSGRTTFVTRALLGLLEGYVSFRTLVAVRQCKAYKALCSNASFRMLLYLSYFYKNSELPVRLAYFWTSLITTHIIASSLAYGILHLRWQNGLAGWRWLFAIEGGVTALIGILSRLYLPPSPTQAKRTGLKGLLRGEDE